MVLFYQQWLQQIAVIVKQLHVHFIGYTKLAAHNDQEYRHYSPYITNAAPRPLIEFPTGDEVIRDVVKPARKSIITDSWLISKLRGNSHVVSQSAARVFDGLKWSLHRKEKFEETLTEFKKWTQKLKDLIPYLLESGHWKNEQSLFLKLVEDPRYAIFEPHIRLREIARNPETGKKRPLAALPKVLTNSIHSRCRGKVSPYHRSSPQYNAEAAGRTEILRRKESRDGAIRCTAGYAPLNRRVAHVPHTSLQRVPERRERTVLQFLLWVPS